MSCNLILHIPHTSTWITAVHCNDGVFLSNSYGAFMMGLHAELLPMTDWYTDELFINGLGIPVVAPVSRIICDTERFRDDEKEPMAKIGMGACYTKTHDLKFSYPWKDWHREWVLKNIYDVHHRFLELSVERALGEHGKALILDCHSFSPIPLPYEPDQNPDRPDICIGTDLFHTPSALSSLAMRFFEDKGYSVRVNSPYCGTIVPLKHLGKDSRVMSLMVEVNRGLYLQPGTNEKNDYFCTLKTHLKEFQERIIHF